MNNKASTNQEENTGCSPVIIICGILAFIISIMLGFNAKPDDAGFWVRSTLVFASIIGGTPGGIIGGVIGDALRRIACPDAIFTSGGMTEILKQKLFWAIGPQAIGTLIGSIAGVALTAGTLSKYAFGG